MNKKLAGIFAICALLLTGCQGAKESSKEITPPDTGWGKTVDEVLADWNLDRDQVEIFSETESAAAIAVDTEATVFGEKTSRVMFQFINLDQTGATGKPVLCEVDITYPDDADMDTVKKEMEQSYGSSKDSTGRTTPNRQAWQPPYAHPAQKHFQCLKKTVSASKLIRDWYMSR